MFAGVSGYCATPFLLIISWRLEKMGKVFCSE